MTADEFRQLALELPGVVEQSHMGHPDFRLGGRIFATLGYPDTSCGMVKLTLDQQGAWIAAEPEVFSRVKGAWGKGGATLVHLRAAKKMDVRKALKDAWRNLDSPPKRPRAR